MVEITRTGRCGGDYGDRDGVLKVLRGGEFGQGRDRGEVEEGGGEGELCEKYLGLARI